MTDAIILEIGNALARSYKPEAVEIIRDFLESDDVEVVRMTSELFDKAFLLYEGFQDKEWGLVDCLSFVVMRERGITEALTADQHFAQAGFHALMRE